MQIYLSVSVVWKEMSLGYTGIGICFFTLERKIGKEYRHVCFFSLERNVCKEYRRVCLSLLFIKKGLFP